jgi:hypothetical protein
MEDDEKKLGQSSPGLPLALVHAREAACPRSPV